MNGPNKTKLTYINSMLYWMCGEIENLPVTSEMSDDVTRSIAEAFDAVGAALRVTSGELMKEVT